MGGETLATDLALTAPRLTSRAHAPRLLIVSASMGAGHMTAAEVLARRAECRGAQTRIVDLLDLPARGQGHVVRGFYRLLVTRVPTAYDVIMRLWGRYPGAFEAITSVNDDGYLRALRPVFQDFRPDLVVSTYNLAGQLLGRLRQRGQLPTPLIAYVTDAGPHPYWVSPGADLHLVPLEATGVALQRLGAAKVRTVTPLVDDGSKLPRPLARRRLGLAQDVTIAVVNGGSWGVGPVSAMARALVAGDVTPYVLCGHSDRLARKVTAVTGTHAIRWTDEVSTWIAAADVVVDSAGGTTCWEALLADRPVILHQPLAGHGRLNAEMLARAGLVTVTMTDDELRRAALSPRPPRRSQLDGDDAADVVLAELATVRTL